MLFRYIYSRSAALQLGKQTGLPFASEWLRGKAHGIKSTFSAVSGAVDLMGMEREAQAAQSRMTEQQLFEYSTKMTRKVSQLILSAHTDASLYSLAWALCPGWT